ncbi:CLUMA_CG009081, isoform A [Clunio marinus]|uniref:CLUMA_CG009081, isoform A n=1 Tax=Clunio marinus TaxID=568069 RepID=A0A1J1I5L3_9DIPT|nr:CLUMA_CG009081, isoform A [Clunio marinus]
MKSPSTAPAPNARALARRMYRARMSEEKRKETNRRRSERRRQQQKKQLLEATFNLLVDSLLEESVETVLQGEQHQGTTLSISSLDSEQICLCKDHENFSFLVTAISKYLPGCDTTEDFLEIVTCDINDIKCMAGHCLDCNEPIVDILYLLISPDNINRKVKYKQLQEAHIELLVLHENTVGQLISIASEKASAGYKFHHYTNKVQQIAFENNRANSSVFEVFLHIDYASRYADEVTIFTAIVYAGENHLLLTLIADDATEDYCSTITFLKAVIKELKEKFPTVMEIKIVSADGNASHFKSKSNLGNLVYYQQDYEINTISWDFFALYHGKGEIDFVGNSIKNYVKEKADLQNVIIDSAEKFYTYAKDHEDISVIYVKREELVEDCEVLKARTFSFPNIEGLENLHHFEVVCGTTPYDMQLKCWPTSKCEEDFEIVIDYTLYEYDVLEESTNNKSVISAD